MYKNALFLRVGGRLKEMALIEFIPTVLGMSKERDQIYDSLFEMEFEFQFKNSYAGQLHEIKKPFENQTA